MGLWKDLAEWRGPTVNCGDGDQYQNEGADRMNQQRGVVIHIAQGYYEGTIAWQKNPDANVSSHFIVDFDGRIAQLVDTDIAAWTQRDGNGEWLSVENAGFVPTALTPGQVEANAQLLARAHQVYGVPLQLATSPSGRGLGHHSMGCDYDWGHCECPGTTIINQKPQILARAQQIVSGVTPEEAEVVFSLVQDQNDPTSKVYVADGIFLRLLATQQDLDDFRYLCRTGQLGKLSSETVRVVANLDAYGMLPQVVDPAQVATDVAAALVADPNFVDDLAAATAARVPPAPTAAENAVAVADEINRRMEN